jgi:small-conductance mechanosensitive channel
LPGSPTTTEMITFLEFLHFPNTPWLMIGLAGLAGLIISFIVVRIIRLRELRKRWKALDTLSENLTGVLHFFVPIVFITVVTKYFTTTNGTFLWTYGISKALMIAITTWLLVRIVMIIEMILINELDFQNPDNHQARRLFTKIKFIKRIIVIMITLMGVSILLLSFESVRQYGVGILTSAGIASVIIGFAAQKSLGNLLAGIQIAFTQPIKIDDVVIVEGEWGRIEEINLTYVVVNIWDLRRLVLPITYFVEKPFQNWTRNESNLIGSAFFRLNYRAPVSELRKKLEEILQNTPLWDGNSWALQVTDTEGQYMVVRAIMSARSSSQAFDLRCLVREELIAFIREHYPEALPGFRVEYEQAPPSHSSPDEAGM